MPLGEQLGASGHAQTITLHDLLHRRCGVDPKEDILAAIAAMPPAERVAAQAVVAEMEAEGRRTLELMPGAVQLARWLEAHGVPTAMVTRNTAATVAHLHATFWQPAGSTITRSLTLSRTLTLSLTLTLTLTLTPTLPLPLPLALTLTLTLTLAVGSSRCAAHRGPDQPRRRAAHA